MSELEEIQKIIEKFICESQQTKKQIEEIEKKRTQLAEKRNKFIKTRNCEVEISILGKQISELGNQSQELQNKLDKKFNETKKIVNLTIDNLITEGIRKVRKMDEEQYEFKEKVLIQKEREEKYEIQKKEFYERFGRLPQLSENAQKEDKIQDKRCSEYKIRIKELGQLIKDMETELIKLAKLKRNFKNKYWSNFENSKLEEENIEKNIVENEETIILPLIEEEIQIEEIEPIEYIEVEEFQPIEEIQIEEFNIEQFEMADEFREHNTNIDTVEKSKEIQENNEIEKFAKTIVEEIIKEQTKELKIEQVEEKNIEKDIINYEKKENVEIKQNDEKITLLNIIAKIEDREVIYKAQISNGDELKIYPTLEARNILLNDKESREKIKEILINYANKEYKMLDKKVIKKLDPTICKVLKRFAQKYKYNEEKLIYNYAMSFSRKVQKGDDMVIPITYNFSYLLGTNLSKKEKGTISKICKNALNNSKIYIVGGITGISKIKYMLKRLFATNNVKTLPDGNIIK